MGLFESMGVVREFCAMLSRKNIAAPSEIQKLVIPELLNSNGNVLFTSPTGTGKTLAYLLPLLQNCILTKDTKDTKVRLLILAPTYELCAQIKHEVEYFTASVALLIGQVPLSRQIDLLKKSKPLVAVGNPARIHQLVEMKKLHLSSLCAAVFDEGDRLVGEEFFSETAAVASVSPKDCRFVSCSATFSEKAREKIISLHDGEWKIIAQEENDILKKNITHWAFFSEERKKISTLRSFLAAVKPKKALVFAASGVKAGNIVSQLQHHKIAALSLSGSMEKKSRKAALDGFRKGAITVLVSSDLAARGLDIAGITHVVALDVSEDPEVYLHRAGRTARAGKKGVIASIGTAEEMRRLAAIEKKLKIAVYPKELREGKVVAPE